MDSVLVNQRTHRIYLHVFFVDLEKTFDCTYPVGAHTARDTAASHLAPLNKSCVSFDTKVKHI